MPNWLRWTLILPVAVIAYFAIQIVVGIGSERLPLSDYLQDSASQLINSILGPWAFVYPSSQIAPVGKSSQTAVFLTTLFFIITIVMGYILLRAGNTGHPIWWFVVTGLVSLGSAVVACQQVRRGD